VLNSNEKVLTINKQYFYILFSNLLWNAIKYSKKWAKIEISLNKNNFSIKDNWIWIKKHDIDKIFDRFYMSEQCRNVDGHGIWLSLVKKIADMYNFKIKVNSEIWKWTEFIVEY
jgi:signal transduction histidine kinase